MKVQFTDLWLQHKEVKSQIQEALERVLKRGDFILGEDEVIFEKEFAKFCKVQYAVGVSSGTAALFLALKSLAIGKDDEVIVPSFTYIATALAVSYTGAKPVFSDIEEHTYNIDPAGIKRAITKKTKAIIPVHLYGRPADLPEILKIAHKYNIKVIEDAAQAHGAAIEMGAGALRFAGGIGDIGCFSFYPSKNLGALGDGGIITTNSKEIYRKLLMLRDYGRISKYEHKIVGYNSRLDTLQAAVLRIKLKKLNKWNHLRGKAATLYDKLFKDINGVIIPSGCPSTIKQAYHVYAIRVQDRDRVYSGLIAKGIGAIIHYPIPLHLQEAYRDLGYQRGDLPVSERIAQEIISLPMHPYLTEKQIKYVVNSLKKLV